MKSKLLVLAVAGLLAGGGLWLARSAWRSDKFALVGGTNETVSTVASAPVLRSASHQASTGVGSNMPPDHPKSGHTIRPPDQNRRFMDFTPEQRVQQARQGHG